jgi:primary-amine oxidase
MAGLALLCAPAVAAPAHPLDPLEADEILMVRTILTRSGQFSKTTNFAWIRLAEPAKAEVEAFRPGQRLTRQVALDAIDYERGKTFGVVVDLNARAIASLTDLGTLQPGMTDRDGDIARDAINADPRIKQALIARGYKIPGRVSDAVSIQHMPVGIDRSLENESGRLQRVLFLSGGPNTSATSPFIDGLMAVVDLYRRRVIRFHDVAGAPSERVPHDLFDRKLRRTPGKPKSTAAKAARHAFAIDGQTVTWRNWQMRLGFNPREGLVLHQVGFNEAGRLRPILYRASVSEVLTVYGDPSEFWSWMQIFDEASLGLGLLSIAARPGREVPADAATLSPLLPEPTAPKFSERLADRIYVYERDAGTLMYYEEQGRRIHARARELVVGSLVSLGNYIYGFNWVFRPDGSFAFEAELAGAVASRFVRDKACGTCDAIAQGVGPNGESRTYESSGSDRFGGVVHSRVVGVSHQHWFNLRLDFDLDGAANAVSESNLVRTQRENAASPDSAPISVRHTVFGRAEQARRRVAHESARTWTIFNPALAKRSGRRGGYTLMPMGNTPSIYPRSREREPVGFAAHHVWVTPYRHGQHYAAGAYPGQAARNYTDTLYFYSDNSPIYDTDIVFWYSLGDTHIPRPEDFPLMSNKKVSVSFHPEGFFERNPALGSAVVEESPSPAQRP